MWSSNSTNKTNKKNLCDLCVSKKMEACVLHRDDDWAYLYANSVALCLCVKQKGEENVSDEHGKRIRQLIEVLNNLIAKPPVKRQIGFRA